MVVAHLVPLLFGQVAVRYQYKIYLAGKARHRHFAQHPTSFHLNTARVVQVIHSMQVLL